jgi:hypothetical protein
MIHPSTRPVALLVVLITACKGDPKPTLVLDAATVSDRLESIGQDVPGCDVTGGASLSRVAPAVRGLRTLMRALPAGGPLMAGSGSTGACGGDLTVEFSHESGVTDYTLHFNDLCLTSADGNITVSGDVSGREIGTPSDAGPVIEAMEVATVGAVTITQNGQTTDIVVTGGRAEYGKPEAWAPGEPDAANPDVVTLDNATATYSSDGRTEYVTGLRYERTGGDVATVTVTQGQLGRTDEAFVTMATVEGDPIVVDLVAMQVQSGTVRLAGADDTELLVRPGETTGTLEFDLDGAPFASGLDCSAGRQPLVQAGVALIVALPIY